MATVKFFDAKNAGGAIYRMMKCFKIENSKNLLYQDKIKPLDEPADLDRQPPVRSHARGIMSRYQMDKLDGINVKAVLQRNAWFYSREYSPVDDGEAIPSKTGDRKIITDSGRLDETLTDSDVDGKGKKKTPLKRKIANFFRRLICVPLKTEN